MHITLRRTWTVIDGSKDRHNPRRYTTIPEGTFEFERIRNPYRHPGNSDWLVLVGTMIGAPENYWRQCSGNLQGLGPIHQDSVVVIEEEKKAL